MKLKESIELKGLAIIMMFWHHLFGCGTFLSGGKYFEWIPLFGRYDAIIGEGCNLCVSLFLFISGYGLFTSYIHENNNKKILYSIIKFIIQYWTILFALAISYLVIVGRFNPEHLMINLFALIHNDEVLYLSFSWYVKLNLLVLLVCPLIKLLSRKINNLYDEILIYIIIPVLVSPFLPNFEEFYCGIRYTFISSIGLLLKWLPIFYFGVLVSKYKYIESLRSKYAECNKIIAVTTSIILIIFSIYNRYNCSFNPILDCLWVFFIVIGFDCIYNMIILSQNYLDKLFYFLGKYSFQYWLVSGMFFLNTTELFNILYIPKYSILILIWNFILITPIVLIVREIGVFIGDMLVARIKKVD